jgi:glycerophosphoryl diester phosphodiesterase
MGFGVEHSLGACAAALDLGGDGCVVSLRRTADGVVILFEDDTLDRMTDGYGRVGEAAYRELVGVRLREVRHQVDSWPPPTFAALLDVARARRMLLHLDLKDRGIEDEVMRLLDAADAWDQVVWVSEANAGRLRADVRYRPLRYKDVGLCTGRLDLDPESVRVALGKAGEMVLVDDPRVAAVVLRRAVREVLPYTVTFRVTRAAPGEREGVEDGGFRALPFVRQLAMGGMGESEETLVGLLTTGFAAAMGDTNEWSVVDRAAAGIVARAWAAQQLGRLGRVSDGTVGTLMRVAADPTRHGQGAYDGLDGAEAIRALGALRQTGASRSVVDVLRRVGQERGVCGERLARAAMVALGQLRCRASRRFLFEYVALGEEEAGAYGPLQYEEAARALLGQKLSWTQVCRLLRSSNPAVRRGALVECLNHPTGERDLALRRQMPWAAGLARGREDVGWWRAGAMGEAVRRVW